MSEFAVLGGGCFWCTEAAFKELDGVLEVTPGYSGGHKDDPSYEEVCKGGTGHAEVVEVEYDPEKLDFEDVLDVFFSIHDPTQEDRQGPDIGTQYRSTILYRNEEQQRKSEAKIEELQQYYEEDIVTETEPLRNFYPAEDKHQDYFEKNPDDAYCRIHAQPKVEKVRENF